MPMELTVENWDFGCQIGLSLGAYIAQWPDRGEPLTISWPATWREHLKQAIYRRLLETVHVTVLDDEDEVVETRPRQAPMVTRARKSFGAWAERRWPVRMVSQTYRARHFLPAVKVPPGAEDGQFFVWDGNWNTDNKVG